MKKRLCIIIVITLTFMLAAPMAVFAAASPPPGAIGGTLSVEYRFMSGQAPNIPQTIERFGFTYHLVSQSDPILESTLPNIRTYQYRIEGAMSPEQKAAIEGLGEIEFEEVDVAVEREVDVEFKGVMNTNDVDDIDKQKSFTVTSAFTPGKTETKKLDLVGVTFSEPTCDSLGLPTGYEYTAVYRGVETYEILGYYLANMTYISEEDGEIDVFVIVAEYQTDEMPPPIEIADGTTPLASGGTGLTPAEESLLGQQTGNPIADIANGLVPLGGPGVTNAWSFASMLLSIAGAVMAIVFIMGFLSRRKGLGAHESHYAIGHIEAENRGKRLKVLRIATIVVAVATPASWIMLDNFSVGMVWINAFTPIIAIMFGLAIVMCAITNTWSKKALSEDGDGMFEQVFTVA